MNQRLDRRRSIQGSSVWHFSPRISQPCLDERCQERVDQAERQWRPAALALRKVQMRLPYIRIDKEKKWRDNSENWVSFSDQHQRVTIGIFNPAQLTTLCGHFSQNTTRRRSAQRLVFRRHHSRTHARQQILREQRMNSSHFTARPICISSFLPADPMEVSVQRLGRVCHGDQIDDYAY